MPQLNRLTRLLIIMLFFGAACGICADYALAQETPKSSRQRLRRVGTAPAQPTSATIVQTAPSSEAPAAAVDADEVVRVSTDLTNILLTAIGKERGFVTTLRREDVRVLENGAAQEISIFQRETELPLSLAILIDASESQKGVLPDEKAAARSFLDAVIRPDKDRAAIVSFTGIPVLEQPLTNDASKLQQAIERVQIVLPRDRVEDGVEDGSSSSSSSSSSTSPLDEDEAVGYTGIWDAIWATTNDALSQTPERTRRAIILLSDGDDTSSQTKKQEAIDFAVKHNTVVYSIGIRDSEFPEGKLDRDALRKVSEKTGGRAFFPQNETELRASFRQIQDELRSQYLIAYSPTNKLRDGSFRKVQIEVVNSELRKQKLSLLYRQGYYARKPPAKP